MKEYKHTKIYKHPVNCICNYDLEADPKKAIGYHGNHILFIDGSMGMRRSWTISDKVPYDNHEKPNIEIGQILKSPSGSIEGMVCLIAYINDGYITHVGNLPFTNAQLFYQFKVGKNIECIESVESVDEFNKLKNKKGLY